MAADTDNGRVTLAVLGERMLGLDEKIDRLDTKLDRHCDSHDGIETRLREVEVEQGAQKVHLGVVAGINAAFTALGMGLMAAFRK
jgi:hypothetical protein